MSSLDHFLEGKQHEKFAADFLNLAGLPTFEETKSSVYARHPNIVPILGVLTTSSHINLIYPKTPYTLENILHFSPGTLQSDWHKRFLLYQVVSALAYLHGLGIAHGNVCPSNILLTHSCWSWLNVSNEQLSKANISYEESTESSSRTCCCVECCDCQSLYSNLNLSASRDWPSDFKKWWAGEMSNYEYLLVLNRLAGRRWGDHTFYPVMPWVIDFCATPDEKSDIGWRDLQKSKWRLAKGDEQLDFTYSTSDVPHHVSDECLSELAVCSYKARRLPLGILRSAVRSVYEPNEYPANMQRLYQWTPDECIPEFYSDPQIFSSLHPGMSDLALPAWATSAEDFISLHRKALESDRVSQQIHHWIDITFGYKLSGQPSIAAKNVMLQASDPTIPRCTGRRQLFTGPHPKRRIFTTCSKEAEARFRMQEINRRTGFNENEVLPSSSYLQDMEEVATFCENSRVLYPLYTYLGNLQRSAPSMEKPSDKAQKISAENFYCDTGASTIDSTCFLEYFDVDGSHSTEFQDLLRWKHNSSFSDTSAEDHAKDIFSVGCILAEVYLKKPLFDKISFDTYLESGVMPEIIGALSPNVALLVEECIQRDWRRRPSAKYLLESQYFSSAIRSAYVFLAPLQLLSKPGSYLQYAAKLADKGFLKAMGPFALEMCVPYFIPAILGNLSDVQSEAAFFLLKEIVKILDLEGIKTLVLPSIQKILQTSECSNLKIFLLQESFVREIWKRLGKQVYLEKIHPFVISNVCNSPNKISASAASVLLICSSEELGLPITLHQTVIPLIYSLGKGISPDGIDVLVRIGSLLGENFIVRQLLPLLRHVILSWMNASSVSKSEPSQSWNCSALLDALSALHGLSTILPSELVLKELVVDQTCLHVKIMLQYHLDLTVIQVAATTLIAVCQRIGPESTALHVLPQLKELFDELAYSQDMSARSHSSQKKGPTFKPVEASIESRADLVCLLYPSFASLIGIEKLRQCCSRWLLLEQHLQRCYNWKWECAGEIPKNVFESTNVQKHALSKISSSEYKPAKLLLNGAGWSMPLSQGPKSSWNVRNFKQGDTQQDTTNKDAAKSNFGNLEPWFWFPGPSPSWCSPELLGRVGSIKDDIPWKIKSRVLHSIRAHPAALRSSVVNHDECVVFTGGVGPGFKGTVQKWEMPRMNCISGYYGHDEVVNDICLLSLSGRIASCDGTVHVWNSQTGKLLAAHAEPSISLPPRANALTISSRVETDQTSMLIPSVLSGGILSTTFSGSLYTCMHYLEASDTLVVGMGNGSVRFLDVAQDRKLHLWKSSTTDCSFSSLVSAICCSGSKKNQVEREAGCSSWIAAGLSSGHCRLLDVRSGDIIAHWKAHDGYITKLASPDDRLLVSSSLDKTLRVWDLRRNLQYQSNIIKGHSDGVSSFAIWGKDVVSVSRNKIGLSSLSRSFEEREQQLLPQKLYTDDRGTRNLSVLSSISILPFSRLFIVGTEDGYLKICC